PAYDKPEEKAAPQLTGDLAAVKNVIDLARHAKTSDATDVERTITDPAAQKLAEWSILRHPDSQADLGRYAAFISGNPDWPRATLMRRRAEARLWQEKSDAATVHAFTADHPMTAKGRFALARTLISEGDRDRGERMARDTFRSEELSERAEADVIEAFHYLLRPPAYSTRLA